MKPGPSALTLLGSLALLVSAPPLLAATLEGRVANWPGGQGELFVDGDGPTPDTVGAIEPSGAFHMELDDDPETLFAFEQLPCMNQDGVAVDNGAARVAAHALLIGVKAPGAFSPDTVLGRIAMTANGEVARWLSDPVDQPAAKGHYGMFLYTDGAVSAEGECTVDMSFLQKPAQTGTYDLTTAPGWNLLVSEVTALSDDEPPAVTAQSVTAMPVSEWEGTVWFVEN